MNALLELVALDGHGVRHRLAELSRGGSRSPELAGLVDAIQRLALTDLSRAVLACEQLVAEAPHEAGIRSRLLAARANVLSLAGRVADAEAVLAEARHEADLFGESFGRAAVEHAAIQPLARLGRLNEAQAAAHAALTHYSESGEHRRAASVRMNLGILTRMLGQPAEALAHFGLAHEYLSVEPMTLGALESNRAEALLDLNRFAEAEAACRVALAAFQGAQNSHAAAIVEGNLGDLLAREGRVDEALASFERARLAFERAGATGDVARLYIEEAEALASIGSITDSAARFRQSIPQLEAASLKRELARARASFGRLLAGCGEPQEATQMLGDAAALWRAIGDASSVAECELACAALDLPQTPAANVERALERLADRPVRLATVLLDLASSAMSSGSHPRAREWLQRANDLIDVFPLKPLRARHANIMGRLLMLEGDGPKSLAELRLAVELADGVRASLRVEQLRSGVGDAWGQLHKDACIAALDHGGARAASLAFEVIERKRGRVMLESLGTPPSDAPASNDELERRHATLSHELNALYNAASSPRSGTLQQEMHARVALLEEQTELLRQRIGASAMYSPAFTRPLTIDAAIAALQADRAAVVFFEDMDALGAIVITRKGATVLRRIADSARVAACLRRLAFEIEKYSRSARLRSADAPERALLEQLGTLLWGPIEGALGDSVRVGISPCSTLMNVPFNALIHRGVPILERHECAVIPSVSAGLMLEGLEPAVPVGVLSVGVGDIAAPRAAHESERVVATVPGTIALTHDRATSEAVLRAMPQASALHFACHGLHAEAHPMSSRLRLADRWVTARELAGRVSRGAVVCLSACESARVGAENSDEALGLSRAFLASGARSVIGCRWPLSDQFAALTFPGIVGDVAQGAPASAAVRRIQTEWWHSGVSALEWGGLSVLGAMP